jgi:hypothetical protein
MLSTQPFAQLIEIASYISKLSNTTFTHNFKMTIIFINRKILKLPLILLQNVMN